MKPTNELYSSIQIAFDYFNSQLFNDGLPDVLFTFQRKNGCMGYFSNKRWVSLGGKLCDEIAINPTYVSNCALVEFLQTLVHEMVHSWQFHFGKPSRSGYHNKEWANKMESLGLMPSSTGKEGGKKTGQQMADYPIKHGLFITTSIALVKNNHFIIPWLDRFQNQEITSENIPSVLLELVKDYENTDEFNALVSLVKPVDSVVDDTMFISPSVQNTTKHKYSCPKCNANVWGKPKLSIVCGTCQSAFFVNN